MLLRSLMPYLIGELSKNLHPKRHLARRLCTFAQPYQECMVICNLNVLLYRYGQKCLTALTTFKSYFLVVH